MTIFSQNSIFKTSNKFIKFGNGSINVIDGANTLASLSLCSAKIPYKQYQKTTVLIPKGQTNYVVSAPMMGVNTTFVAIVPKFCCTNKKSNFLKWNFMNSTDPKMTLTNILVLSGSTTNPIQPIILDNPNDTCDIEVDILIGAMDNDYLNDINAYLYLNNLMFDNIHATNNLFSFYNSNGELAGTLDVSDITNIITDIDKKRIIIDESSDHNIILEFKDITEMKQALSAINWFLLDSAVRTLPQPKDETAPILTLTNDVVSDVLTISLNNQNYTKSDFITDAILSVVDNRDGIISITPTHIIFKQITINTTIIKTEVAQINVIGNYEATINVSDIAGNLTTKTITINVNL